MRSKKLKNAPLKEAIFELFWQSPSDTTGFPVDKDFEFALGKFDTNISPEFPVKKSILPSIPGIRVYGRPTHQFWRGDIVWPVVQLGPGILTVNDTDKNYEWEKTYRPNIVNAIDSLIKSYSKELPFNRITLKYIDSVDIEVNASIHEFINENLQTSLVNQFKTPGKPLGININQIFSVDESLVSINIQTATNNVTGKKALVWMITVERNGKISKQDIFSWIDYAHGITSDLFVEMLNPQFYANFNK